MSDRQIATADSWKKLAKQKWLLPVPSGVLVVVRRLDVGRAVADQVVDEDLFVKLRDGTLSALEKVTIAKRVLPRVLVQPALGEDLSADDIWVSDLMTIFWWSLGFGNIIATEVEDGQTEEG